MAYESWRVYIGFGRDPNDRTAPLTDVTSSVDTKAAPVLINRGRSSERSTIQNGTCSFALQNSDQRHTPGNPFSQYAPWVLAGRRVVVTDTVDGEEFALFDGFLEFPDAEDWQKSSEDAPRDQVITVSAVDRVARLEQYPAFLSTVGALVQTKSTALEMYYPLVESSGLEAGEYARGRVPLRATSVVLDSTAVPQTVDDLVRFGQGAAALKDDLGHLLLPALIEDDGFGTLLIMQSGYLTADSIGSPITIRTGDYLVVAAWVKLDPADPLFNQEILTIGGDTAVQLVVNASTDEFELRYTNLAWGVFTLASGVPVEYGKPTLIGAKVQLGVSQELWIDDAVYTGSIGGSPPSSASFYRDFDVGRFCNGSIGHLQFYKNTYTNADFLDQLEAGMTGYERQRVNERIATIAELVGLDADELELDTASALMPAGRLAGQTAGALMRTAAEADNGLLFADGSGRVVFHSRARRYRPPLAATVDLTWLEQPLQWRTDPPTNAMDVASTDGASGRATNADSVSEYGERSGSASLETACGADPGNLAAFTVREFARPRHRATSLAFELRTRTDEQRKLILRREISDRCAFSGLPDNAPEGTNTFHIEGIRHRISVQGHRVEWNTGSVLGDVPGVVQPYPRVGTVTSGPGEVRDTFSRVTANGWGTSDSSHAWTAAGGGAAADYSTDGSSGLMSANTTNVERQMLVNPGWTDAQIRLWATVPVVPTGAAINWGALLRWTDGNNYVWVDVQVGTDSSLTLRLLKRVGGALTAVTTVASGVTHSTTVPRILKAQIVGDQVQARVWSSDATEPDTWQLDRSEAGLPTGTLIGCINRLMTGNTNGTVVTAFDNVRVEPLLAPQAKVRTETRIAF